MSARGFGLIAVLLVSAAVIAACTTLPPTAMSPATAQATQAAATPAPEAAPAGTSEAEATNLAVVKRFYDEYAAGNAGVILETYATTVTMHYAGDAEPVPAQVLADDLAAIKQANPDLHAEIHDMWANGNYVFTELTWTATHTGEFFGIPATGETVRHPGIVVRRLEDGKIVESWEIWDDLTFLNSVGYVGSWDEIVAGGGSPANDTPSQTPEMTPSASR